MRGVSTEMWISYILICHCHTLSLLFKGAYWFILVEVSFTRELNREPSAFFTYLLKVWLDALIEFNKPVLFHFWYYSGLLISNLTKTMDRKKFARHGKKSDWMGKKTHPPPASVPQFFSWPPLHYAERKAKSIPASLSTSSTSALSPATSMFILCEKKHFLLTKRTHIFL